MGDARAKGAGNRGGSSLQQIYFQLSSASAEDARLRAQLDLLRVKERQTLHRLEQVAQHMSRLGREIKSLEEATGAQRGKQPNEQGYGSSVWDVTELRY